jgi:hypothetical protein
MKFVTAAAKAFFFAALGAAIAYVVWAGSNLRLEPNPNISSADLLAIILTALGVILAAIAVFLGGMALVSWRYFDERVGNQVEDYLNKFVKPTERYEAIEELLRDHREKTKKLAEAEKELENLSNFDEDAV